MKAHYVDPSSFSITLASDNLVKEEKTVVDKISKTDKEWIEF